MVKNIPDKKQPLVSVIVPIYGTEELLPKCLDSIINQTYKYLEIICVNDCSPGPAKSIVAEYQHKDNRIKYIEHTENRGLFQARVSGSELATGDYIAFIDSDDYISIDYYRLLVEKAVNTGADIVEARIVREDENGGQFIQNLNNILLDELNGREIQDQFFSQEGRFYHWHVIWNKVYSIELWKKCLPYFKKQTAHLIMTEDVAFSSLLYYNAKKYCSIDRAWYFYYVRAEASTGTAVNVQKLKKYIADMGIAFDFVENYLKYDENGSRYIPHVLKWKERYFRLWAGRVKNENVSVMEKRQLMEELTLRFRIEKVEPIDPEDYYFSLLNTPWDPRLEILRKLIVDDTHEYVSFDIFDTLVVRPFYDPKDLFILLDDYFHEIYPNSPLLNFSSIRLQAESRVRELIRLHNPTWQDVNLDEIYDFIETEYSLPAAIVEKLKNKEIALELKFIQRRETTHELYRMALALNKKVIFVSDMYLTSSVVSEMLKKTGYDEYERLFISSETRQLKHTGDMFNYIINELKVEPSSIIHIGDNWESDKIMAENMGWNSFFVGKTMDLMLNRLSDKESGSSVQMFHDANHNHWTSYEYPEYLSLRCMLAVVANKIFDNPFPSFQSDSDFNCDPYFVGYYALGMHVFGVSKWLIEHAIERGYETIHFLARDGYLPKQVYQIIAPYYQNAPMPNYLYASRRSLLPYILSEDNQYSLEAFVSLYAHSPKTILEIFRDYLKPDWENKIKASGIIISKKFNGHYEFKKFVDILIAEIIDQKKIQNYTSTLKNYYNKQIKQKDATFDLGYSAKLQTIIVNLLSRPCDAYFVHTNKEEPWDYSRRNQFKLSTYYSYKPRVSGILREHLFAELAPSCIGFRTTEDGAVEPVFEEYVENSVNRLIVSIIQKSAINFSRDMMKIFGDYVHAWTIRSYDVSLPLETFIHYSRQVDRLLLKHSYTDDFIHGGNDRNSILDWWNAQTSQLSIAPIQNASPSYVYVNRDFLYNRGKIVKAIFYALFDRDLLKTKVKERYSSKPTLLKLISVSYRILRKVKRSVV